MKERIKSIVKYKKPSLWVSTSAVILCCILAAGFLTDPAQKNKESAPEKPVSSESACGENISDKADVTASDDTASKETDSKPVESSKPVEVSKPVEKPNPTESKPAETLEETEIGNLSSNITVKRAKAPEYSMGNTAEFFESLPKFTEKEKQEILSRRGEINQESELEVKQAYLDSWSEAKDRFTIDNVRIIKYYGTYNGAVVAKIRGIFTHAQVICIHEIENLKFLYTDTNYTVVYKNNGFYNLEEAYIEGILTFNDLKKIQEINMIIY